MKRALFWMVLAAVFAVAVHLAYMLFAPPLQFEHALSKLVKDETTPSFRILKPAQQAALLPFATINDVVGICLYDLRDGNAKIEGVAPEGFWNFSVFTSSGRQIYDLNDTQVETNHFVVEIRPASGLLSQIMGGADGELPASTDAGWQVEVPEDKGLAILWVPLHDALMRRQTEAVIRKGRCSAP